jgi:hypothetical protein
MAIKLKRVGYRECSVPRRVVNRIWDNGFRGGGVNTVMNKRAKNCARKQMVLDSVQLS